MNLKFLFILLSYGLYPYFYLRTLINRFNTKERFLIIDTAKIGDLVCSTPVFSSIKKNRPSSFLCVLILSHTFGILKNNPHIDEFIFADKEKFQGFWGRLRLIKEIKKRNFFWSFRLNAFGWWDILPFWAGIPNRATTTSSCRGRKSKLYSLLANYRLEYKKGSWKLKHNLDLISLAGIKPVFKREVYYTKEAEDKTSRILGETGSLIGISTTAGNKLKTWEVEKFAKLADKLIEELDARVVFIGSREDKKKVTSIEQLTKNRIINLAGLFSLEELPALIKNFKLFISLDSGPLYIALALGLPVIDIAGPCDIKEQISYEEKCEQVIKNIYCRPCSYVIPPARFCKEGHLRCLKQTSVDDVFEAVKKSIKKYHLDK